MSKSDMVKNIFFHKSCSFKYKHIFRMCCISTFQLLFVKLLLIGFWFARLNVTKHLQLHLIRQFPLFIAMRPGQFGVNHCFSNVKSSGSDFSFLCVWHSLSFFNLFSWESDSYSYLYVFSPWDWFPWYSLIVVEISYVPSMFISCFSSLLIWNDASAI